MLLATFMVAILLLNKNQLIWDYGKHIESKIEIAGIQDHYSFMQLDLIWELIDKVKV